MRPVVDGNALRWALMFVALWLLAAVVVEEGAWQVAVSCILVIVACAMDIRDSR